MIFLTFSLSLSCSKTSRLTMFILLCSQRSLTQYSKLACSSYGVYLMNHTACFEMSLLLFSLLSLSIYLSLSLSLSLRGMTQQFHPPQGKGTSMEIRFSDIRALSSARAQYHFRASIFNIEHLPRVKKYPSDPESDLS